MSFIAIPISFGNIALMDLILAIFGREYVGAYLAGIVMTMVFLIGLLNSVIDPVIRGGETIDLKDETSLRDYLKSRLFKLITVNHLSAIVYTICVAIFLMLSTGDIYEATLYWSLASFTGIPFMVYKIRMLRDMNVRLRPPLRNILNYTVSSLSMFLLIYALRFTFFDNLAKNIVELLMEITIQTIVGSCLYFSIAFLIDDYAKRILA